MDVGSHTGNWTAALIDKIKCVPHVYLFEPLACLASEAAKRFEQYPQVKVVQSALSDRNGTAEMSYQEWSSSLHLPQAGEVETIALINILDFLAQEKLSDVNLISINVEGHEFPLLELLTRTGDISVFQDVQVQFHEFMPQARERRIAIRNRLMFTHEERYCYPFIWESWRRK
jgi:FkbM family methyltransferase